MDQAATATFKMYYVSRTISGAVWATDKKDGPIMNKFWRGYIWMQSIILETPSLDKGIHT
jgi:hypothetical protein